MRDMIPDIYDVRYLRVLTGLKALGFEFRRQFLWSPYVIGQTIIFLPCDFYLSSFFPHLISAAVDWMSTILPHMVWHPCGLSANLGCRSETWCTRLAGNTGRKEVAKNRHLGTIAQLRRAISSQIRHVSTIGKKTC